MECRAKEESEKKIRRKRGRGTEDGGGLSPLPHPLVVVVFFSTHISFRCPHDLNAWNRLGNLGRGTQRPFSENICSEDDLRSRIFGTFVVKFLACLPLLGFSNT